MKDLLTAASSPCLYATYVPVPPNLACSFIRMGIVLNHFPIGIRKMNLKRFTLLIFETLLYILSLLPALTSQHLAQHLSHRYILNKCRPETLI